jgi:hydroxymethylglutaryl-CoA lyase
LLELGCYEVSLGDTVGRGNPEKTQQIFSQLSSLPQGKLAAHLHDTFDTAI